MNGFIAVIGGVASLTGSRYSTPVESPLEDEGPGIMAQFLAGTMAHSVLGVTEFSIVSLS